MNRKTSLSTNLQLFWTTVSNGTLLNIVHTQVHISLRFRRRFYILADFIRHQIVTLTYTLISISLSEVVLVVAVPISPMSITSATERMGPEKNCMLKKRGACPINYHIPVPPRNSGILFNHLLGP